jgi:hypothetical protein
MLFISYLKEMFRTTYCSFICDPKVNGYILSQLYFFGNYYLLKGCYLYFWNNEEQTNLQKRGTTTVLLIK